MVTKILGPELNEIRQHLQIVPEVRDYVKDVVRVVHDIRNVLAKVPKFDTLSRSFGRIQ